MALKVLSIHTSVENYLSKEEARKDSMIIELVSPSESLENDVKLKEEASGEYALIGSAIYYKNDIEGSIDSVSAIAISDLSGAICIPALRCSSVVIRKICNEHDIHTLILDTSSIMDYEVEDIICTIKEIFIDVTMNMVVCRQVEEAKPKKKDKKRKKDKKGKNKKRK